MRSILHGTGLIVIVSLILQAQVEKSSSTCPPVAAKNRDEALMMEAASNKKGCWVRDDKTGNLMFVNPGGPEYKPLIGDSVGPRVTLKAWSTTKGLLANSSTDLAGTWSITTGTRTTEAELGLIRMMGPQDIHLIEGVELVDLKTEKITFTRKVNGQYCGAAFGEKELCFVKVDPTGYSLVGSKTSNERPCEFHSDGRTFRGKCVDPSNGVGTLFIGPKLQ